MTQYAEMIHSVEFTESSMWRVIRSVCKPAGLPVGWWWVLPGKSRRRLAKAFVWQQFAAALVVCVTAAVLQSVQPVVAITREMEGVNADGWRAQLYDGTFGEIHRATYVSRIAVDGSHVTESIGFPKTERLGVYDFLFTGYTRYTVVRVFPSRRTVLGGAAIGAAGLLVLYCLGLHQYWAVRRRQNLSNSEKAAVGWAMIRSAPVVWVVVLLTIITMACELAYRCAIGAFGKPPFSYSGAGCPILVIGSVASSVGVWCRLVRCDRTGRLVRGRVS